MRGLTVVTGGEVVTTRGETGSDPESLAERLRVLHRRGLSLHHDPVENRLVSYVQAARQVPEQFYVEYVGEGAGAVGAFDDFVEALHRLEAEESWTLRTGDSGKQEVFDALAAGTVAEPSDPELTTELLASDDGPVELGTPDRETAAGLYRWLRRQDPDLRITICSKGAVSELPATDVVVVPDDAESVGEPTGETKLRRARRRREDAIEEARSGLREALDTARSATGSEHAARRRVASALGSTGESGTDTRIRAVWDPRQTATVALSLVLFGVTAGLLAGGLRAVVRQRPAATAELLARSVWVGVPTGLSWTGWIRLAGPIPAWWPLGPAVASVAVAAALAVYSRAFGGVGTRGSLGDRAGTVHEALTEVRGNELTATGEGPSLPAAVWRSVAGSNRSVPDASSVRSEDAGTEGREPFERIVRARVLADLPFALDRPAVSWARRGIAAALLAGGIVGGVWLSQSAASVDPIPDNWLLLVNAVGFCGATLLTVSLARRFLPSVTVR